ncbi:hypothetical protein V5799_005019, partial [Amblyomma americanum]
RVLFSAFNFIFCFHSRAGGPLNGRQALQPHRRCLRQCNPDGHPLQCPPRCICCRMNLQRNMGMCLESGMPLPAGFERPRRGAPEVVVG